MIYYLLCFKSVHSADFLLSQTDLLHSFVSLSCFFAIVFEVSLAVRIVPNVLVFESQNKMIQLSKSGRPFRMDIQGTNNYFSMYVLLL